MADTERRRCWGNKGGGERFKEKGEEIGEMGGGLQKKKTLNTRKEENIRRRNEGRWGRRGSVE